MATYRPKVPDADKRRLVEEAGGRCANPGCPAARVHIHHIKEWAVYQSHDPRYMIAVCPNCHDAIHHGALEISDEALLRWKEAGKGAKKADVIFVEPGKAPLIKLGQIEITGQGGLIVLAPSPGNRFSYRVEEGDLVLVSCEIMNRAGNNIITIRDNRVRFDGGEYEYLQVPGHIRLIGPAEAVLADWMIAGVRSRDPAFAEGPEVILDVEVIAAGQVAIRGIWADEDRAIVVSDAGWIIPRSCDKAMAVRGAGGIHWVHPISHGLFESAFKIW